MSGMSNLRHLKRGEPEPPPPKKDVLRVYGMKFCPFVQRLKLVLAAKGINHETINIDLSKRPKWFLAKAPRKKVPVIEINGLILYESDITSNYVDDVYPGRRLQTSDPVQRAKEAMFLGDFNELVAGIYDFINNETDRKKRDESVMKMKKSFQKIDDFFRAHDGFVCGNVPGMTDYMIWPHLERVGAIMPSILPSFPAIHSYFKLMGKDKAVIRCRHSDALHRQFIDGYKNRNWVYDLGTVEEYNFNDGMKTIVKSNL